MCRCDVDVTFVFIQKFDSKSRMTSFCCLEIHVVPSATGVEEPQSRVFMHSGVLERKATVCVHVHVVVDVCMW